MPEAQKTPEVFWQKVIRIQLEQNIDFAQARRTAEREEFLEAKRDRKKFLKGICPTCNAQPGQECVRGRWPSAVWDQQIPYSVGHSSRHSVVKKLLEKERLHE